MKSLFLATTLTAVASCAGEMPATSATLRSQQQPVDVSTVASNPERFVGRSLTLRGTLSNNGKNYFTDLIVVLTDDKDESFVYIQPWLPTSVPPSLPGTAPRDTLSNYLDKKVELEGTLRFGEVKKVGDAHYLEVTSARILEEDQ